MSPPKTSKLLKSAKKRNLFSYQKKKILKAKSVKGCKKLTEKKKRKYSKAKSVKLSLNKKRLNSLETCSTLSNSANSAEIIEEEEEKINFKPLIDVDVNKTFKLQTRGVVSNIPQIFNSGLFSKSNSKGRDLSTSFIDTALFKSETTKTGSQMKSVTSVLGQLKIFKDTNLEAGSYMASLETTIESINKMKNLM